MHRATPKIDSRLLLAALLSLVALCMPLTRVSASSWHCGSQCNGQPPTWVVPSNGVQCSASAVQVSAGYPTGTYESVGPKLTDGGPISTYDGDLPVRLMYSTTCRTIWAVVTNNGSNGRISCFIYMHRSISPTWNSPDYGCPAPGSSLTTKMVDDYSSTGGIAANVEVFDNLSRPVCEGSYGYGLPCATASNESVPFYYTKAY